MDLHVYTFEDSDGDEDGHSTQSWEDAVAYAKQNELRILDNVYEWQEAIPCEGGDFRPYGNSDGNDDEEEGA